jgi:hypothetical protein
MQSDFDAAWKTALDSWIEQFFEFFFPRIHSRIDWSRPPQSLEQEFQKIQAQIDPASWPWISSFGSGAKTVARRGS